ncbi:DUF1549 domain-containing protein [Crateriforma spongiae]|uniref:DUF1549 domain-containing protein n=1 Tax=Crateriforma spongiae TaxID=2724528 RepID=UPI001F1D73EF|nr:DUF1549 domain-containing protein [Crateriforma spongiae]
MNFKATRMAALPSVVTTGSVRPGVLLPFTLLGCLLAFGPIATLWAESSRADDPAPVSYHRDVLPIFRQNCFGCHQAAKDQGDYRMTDFASLVAGGESGQPAIVPGKPDESYLVEQITPIDGVAAMPAAPMKALDDDEVALVRRWIAEGAADDSPADSGPRYSADSPPGYAGPPTIASIDVSPDGSLIAIAGFHEVLVRQTSGGDVVARLIGDSPRIESVRFSPDGNSIAVAGGRPGEDGEIQIWDVQSRSLRLSVHFTADTLSGASWSPDSKRLAFGGNDNVIRAIDAETGQQVLFQGAHEDWIRDTGFTADGSHLVSVARDMSCKLTEVATERFVDNITSITPGALSGGLNGVAVHPQRSEVVVGGADGVAKVYRVFRETTRRIGDDANLIRRLPALKGRIFSVAIDPAGARIAAAATLDGKSQVAIWDYDFDGTLSDQLKQILGKRVSDRSAEDKQKVEQYRGRATTTVLDQIIDQVVYAIRFAPDGSLWVAAGDNSLRRYDASGQVQRFDALPLGEAQEDERIRFDATQWVRNEDDSASDAEPLSLDDPGVIERLTVQPTAIRFTSPLQYAQLVVTGHAADGSTYDVTRHARYESQRNILVGTRTALLRPVTTGQDTLTIRFGKATATIDVSVEDMTPEMSPEFDGGATPDFIRDVNPVLSRLGCNQGTCHGAQAGKNGFKLSLRGYDPIFDIRALTDDLAARRIDPAHPSESLMLRKPLGLTPHEGGVLMQPGDPSHVILRRWIHAGSPLDMTTPRVKSIEVFPKDPVVQSTQGRQQVRVVATYADGMQRDVTREAFIESGNTEVATVVSGAILSAVRRGEAPILARYEGAYAATTLTVMGDRSQYQAVDTPYYNRIDELVAAKWRRMKIVPSELADDLTFLRRVHLDLTGLPPTADDLRRFEADPRPSQLKRAEVIDQLIGNEAFVEYWTNKWADLLQVNRKFLGVEGSTAFRDWIRQSVVDNKPYDEFAREILTASGSNKDNPPASYYKILRTPEDTMENTTHLFLGIRFNCNKCHDHPFERWTQDQYYQMAAFFARVDLKRDPNDGGKKIGGTAVDGAKPLYEIISDRSEGEMTHARTGETVAPAFPFDLPKDDRKTLVSRQESKATDAKSLPDTRRGDLARWMTDPANPYFARSYVNRVWAYLMGVGLIEPIDDIRAGNPPTNPELLDHLTDVFVKSGFDVRQLMRTIVSSRTYQLSVATHAMNQDDQLNYSHATARRLPAEVIFDAVHSVTGATSSIPGVAPGTRAAALGDAGVKLDDGFLQNLGRPARESACECERSSGLELGPVMALISGPTIGNAITSDKNDLESLVAGTADNGDLVDEIFLRALARHATDDEVAAFNDLVDQVVADHQLMKSRLAESEADWKVRRAELESIRNERLAEIKAAIAKRESEYKPVLAKLQTERQQRIAAAKERLAKVESELAAKIDAWVDGYNGQAAKKDPSKIRNEWYPLAAVATKAAKETKLLPQADRSILATGNADKQTYEVTYQTSIAGITGFRLEAIAADDLPNKGPGRGDNGNFVVTEIEVFASTGDQKPTKVGILKAQADFTQNGFDIKRAFDQATRNQSGWAVAGGTSRTHWATFQFAKPINGDAATSGSTKLTFKIHQYHNAAKHRLGRFRISVTTDADVRLGLPESLDAIVRTAKTDRSEAQQEQLAQHVRLQDKAWTEANAAVVQANKAIPPDAELTRLAAQQKRLETPTPDDSRLVRLRRDVVQSQKQSSRPRLTAAEDLVWALVNSPAFLFNR